MGNERQESPAEYQVIIDSYIDFNKEVSNDPNEIKRIPFQLLIDDEVLTDEGLDSNELIQKIKASKRKITMAYPSLHNYLGAHRFYAVNYVVTISSRLSGSFQSAAAVEQTLEESGGTSKVYVIGNESTSAGQTLVVLQLKRMLEQRMENSQILLRPSHHTTHLQTLFVPISLSNLEKNGRIKGIQVIVSKVLHTILTLGSNGDGVLELKEKTHGEKQTMGKLLNITRRDVVNMTESVLVTTHVDTRARTEELCEKIKDPFSFRRVVIFQASGLSIVYVDDGGIMLSF